MFLSPRTTGMYVLPVVLLALTASALASGQVRYATADTVVLHSKPAGPTLATIFIATPLVTVAANGKWSQVQFFGWSRKGANAIVYADTGSVGSAIVAARIMGAAPKPVSTKTNSTIGVTWNLNMLQGWVETSVTQPNRTALWQIGKSVVWGHVRNLPHAASAK